MKLKIAAESSPDQPSYTNLVPLVEELIRNGNAPSPPFGKHQPNQLGFYKDRDGWVCELIAPINFGLLLQKFDLPASIRIKVEANTISDDLSWVQIRGGVE